MRSVVVVLPASMWATMPMLRTCVSVLSDIRAEIIAYLVAGDVAVDDIGDARADASGTRAAGDVGPYHAQRPVRTHGRARRPRRAAPKGRHRRRPRAQGTPPGHPLNHFTMEDTARRAVAKASVRL